MKWGGLFLLLVILTTSVSAIGISPDRLQVEYEPLSEGELVVYIINTENENINSSLTLEGELAKYFSIKQESIAISSLGTGIFNIEYRLPAKIDTPGLNNVLLKVKKNSFVSKGLGAYLSVLSKIVVDVPYPYKYLEYDFETKSVNEGDEISFDFNIRSKGVKNIFDVVSKVDIYDAYDLDNLVLELEGDKFPLVSGRSRSTKIELNSTEIGIGDYFIDAYLIYDGVRSKHVNKSISVGYEDVDVLNHTKSIVGGGIKKFSVLLKNRWNHDVSKVYIESYLSRDNVPITERSVSHTVDMRALEEVNVPVYLDVSELVSGSYTLVMDIHYSDFVKQEKVEIMIEEKLEISMGMIVAIVLIVLVFLNIVWITVQVERRNKGKGRKATEEGLSYLSGKLGK
ncbi:hypothetical protein HOM75_02555 [Candidatus Woesearchaeota archaeon]|jgi:hypothetical protein|nr:hypothetical protein [Candidatus Woesearchaeota archaeon]